MVKYKVKKAVYIVLSQLVNSIEFESSNLNKKELTEYFYELERNYIRIIESYIKVIKNRTKFIKGGKKQK